VRRLGSTGDLPLAGKWIARCANGELPLPSVGCTILQVLPTNTRRPTRTPTLTPIPTAMPQCPVVANATKSLRIREQPSLDPKNILFNVDSNGIPTDIVVQSDPLWKGNAVQSGTIITLNVIGYIGVIPWVSPTAAWYQVQLIQNGNVLLGTAYVGLDGGNGAACSGASAFPPPAPDPNMPTVPTPAFVSNTSLSNIFGQQAPSYMGNCGFHGTVCTTQGSTFDVVPRNVEYCIDTRSDTFASQCDEASNGQQIPVYVPVAGTLIIYPDGTTAIDIDNGQTVFGNPGPREIVLVHLDGSQRPAGIVNNALVSAGTLVGYLCSNATSAKLVNCNISSITTSTHLAISLRYRVSTTGGTVFQQPSEVRDTLYMLAHALPLQCSYDDWLDQHGSPVRQASNIFRGCP
jgi:hypothetical protein